MPDPIPLPQAEAGFASGELEPTAPQEMVDAEGQPTTVDPGSVKQALAAHYHLTTKEANDHLVALREAGEHPIQAGLEGAARGVLPFAPSLLSAAGDPLAGQQLRAEANPAPAKVGEIVGNIAQAVGVGALTGGLGEVGTAADMIGQGALFGAQSAQNEINEEDLGDHGYNGEAILAHGGLGAVLGAGTSGALGLAKEILPNPITLAGKAISKTSDALTRLVGKGVATLRPELTEQVGKAEVESTAARIAQRAETTPAAARVVSQEDAIGLAKASDDLDSQMGDLSKHVYEELHPAQVESLAAEDAAARAPGSATSTFQDSLKGTMATKVAANDALDEMVAANAASIGRNEGAIYDPTMLKQANGALRKFGEEFNEADDVPKLYSAMRRARQAIDEIQDYAKNPSTPAIKLTTQMIESKIATPFRQALNSPDVFGPRLSAANAALNDAWRGWSQANGAFYRALGARDLLQDGRPADQIVAKPSRILSFLRGEGGLSHMEARSYFQARLDAAQKLVDTATQMAHDGNQSIDTSQITNLLGSIAKRRQEGIASASLAGGVNGGLGYSVGGFGPELAIGAVGHASGIPFAGTVAAGLTRGIRATKYPSASLQMLGRIKGLADRHTAEIASGAAGFFTGAAKVVAPVAAENAFGSGRDSIAKDRQAQITNLTSNPALLEHTLQRNTSALPQNHAMAVQQLTRSRLAVVASAMPPPQPPSAIKVKPPESIDAQDHFERMLNLVNHPTKTVTAGLHDGTLTPDEVAGADRCAPKSMMQLRSALQSEMIDRPDYDYTLGQKLSLGVLFGHSVSPDTDPDFIAFMQSTFQAPPQQQPPRAAGLDKLTAAQNTATPSQAHEMKET